MRAVVQRVISSSVSVDGEVIGEIGPGLMVLLGVMDGDTDQDARHTAEKVVNLRIFQDDDDKMNRSLLDTGGELLAVSQFTLAGDCRKGRRPSFISAAHPSEGERLYDLFCENIRDLGVTVATGRFQAMMQVQLINDGPVTILVDSTKLF
jgi:D-aminoacyl-tRNA deacylase